MQNNTLVTVLPAQVSSSWRVAMTSQSTRKHYSHKPVHPTTLCAPCVRNTPKITLHPRAGKLEISGVRTPDLSRNVGHGTVNSKLLLPGCKLLDLVQKQPQRTPLASLGCIQSPLISYMYQISIYSPVCFCPNTAADSRHEHHSELHSPARKVPKRFRLARAASTHALVI